MVDVDALRKHIDRSGMTIVFISEKSGISRETLYNRLSNQGEFKASEILSLSNTLNMSQSDRDEIFFVDKSELNSLNTKVTTR